MSAILYRGDCLEVMAQLPDACVDMVLCDLPYGKTQNKWDTCIPLEQLWAAYRRLCKPGAAIVLTAAQPFTSVLVCSNLRDFRYSWVWEKTSGTGHLNARRQPLRCHEDVAVFSRCAVYNPQKTVGHARKVSTAHHKRNCVKTTNYREHGLTGYDSTERFPRSVQVFATDKQRLAAHPTQKPVALMEYLIRTYTNPGMTVLDNCMGSGTTGVACINTGRDFIGIEQDRVYFAIAEQRIDPSSGPN